MAIVIPILTEYSNRGVNEAMREMKRAEDKFTAFGNVAKTALLGAAAAAGAFAIKLGVDAVKAAAEDEKAMRNLGQTLENLGFASSQLEVEGFVSRLQTLTGVSDSELRPAFDRLVKSTQDVGDAQAALQLAVDASISSGKSLESVANALGRAYDGSYTSLTKLGLGLDAATIATGDMEQITAELARLTGGAAATAADTYEGRLRRMQVAADEAQETIGYALLGAITDVTDALGGGGGMEQATGELGRGLAGLIEQVGGLVAVLANMTSSTADADKATARYQATSESTYRTVVQFIPIVGSYLSQLSIWHEDAAGAAWDQEQAVAALAARYTAMGAAAAAAADAQAAANAEQANAAWGARYTALAVTQYGQTIRFTGGNLNAYLASLRQVNTATTGSPSGASGSSSASSVSGTSSGAIGATVVLTTAQKLLAKQYEATEAAIEATTAALDAAQDEIDTAIAQLNDYADAYRGWLMSAVSLSAAVDTAASEAGKEAGITWLDAFYAQFADVDKAVAAMNALRATLDPMNTAGNEALVAQLMQLPPGQAAAIATDIVNNGLGPELAAKLESYNLFAGQAGNTWAAQFYQSGVDAAYAQYEAIATTLTSQLDKLYALGRQMGNAVSAGFRDAFRDLPTGTSRSSSSASTYSSAPITVNVSAGVGDPVAIARQIERTLRTATARTGRV